MRADLGSALVEVGDYSFPLATRGETLADRIVILAPLRRAGSGHMNGEALAPGVLHAWGETAEIAGASVGPLQFGIASFTPSTLDRIATVLGVEVDLPGSGGFRVVRAVDWRSLHDVFDRMRCMGCDDVRDDAAREREATALGDLLVELVVRSS